MHIPHAISNHVGDSDSVLLCKGSLRDESIKELPFWSQPHHHINLISGPKDLQELDDGIVANPPQEGTSDSHTSLPSLILVSITFIAK